MTDVENQPKLVSLWSDIELIESVTGDLMAVMKTDQGVCIADIPWILEVRSCNGLNGLEILAILGNKAFKDLRILKAMQHFFFYIDIQHIKEADIWGSEIMTNHFISKLKGFINRTGEDYIRIDAVSKWIQEISDTYLEQLLAYIMKYHSNKW
jgi:hypothetical protein